MANHNSSGPGQRPVDDDRTQWRPDEDSDRVEREPERRDHRPTERAGQGQSGYSAGRRGEDFSQRYQNRNARHPPGGFDERPNPSGMGLDDRFDRTDRTIASHGSAGARSTPAGSAESLEHTDYRPDRPSRDYGADRPGRDDGQERETGYRVTADRSPVYRGMGGHRGKGPRNWQRSDERIREAVNEVLTDHDHIDATHIEVTVVDGEVTLSGMVEERAMKRLAEDCVEQVSGVKEVQNHIRVQRHDGWSAGPDGHGRISEDHPALGGDRKPRA